MRSKKAFYTLLAATIVMVAAAVIASRQTAREPASSHGLHAPDLASRVDAVRTVEIRTADSLLRLERTGDGWVARNKSDYPAAADRIRQLVLGLSRLKRLDRKTEDPERLHRLELRDVDEAGSKAVEIVLLTGKGDAVADILVGKTQDFQQAGRSRYFVRDAGNPQAWLVEGVLPPVLGEIANWLDQALLPGIGEPDLRSVTVSHADGGSITVRRKSGEADDFRLAGLSDGEEINSRYSVNAIPRTLRGLSLKDVRAADVELDEEIATVEASTFNGVRIVARIGSADPDFEVRLRAVHEPDQERGGDGEEARNGGQRLADELNRRWRGRSFVVSQYALDALLVRRADLIKKTEEPATD